MSERVNRKLVLCIEGDDKDYVEDLADKLLATFGAAAMVVDERDDVDEEKFIRAEVLLEEDVWDE